MAGPTPASEATQLALVGVPNCGKTALFNRLTGSRQKVANYAGVTVERKAGQFQTADQPNVASHSGMPGASPSSAGAPAPPQPGATPGTGMGMGRGPGGGGGRGMGRGMGGGEGQGRGRGGGMGQGRGRGAGGGA